MEKVIGNPCDELKDLYVLKEGVVVERGLVPDSLLRDTEETSGLLLVGELRGGSLQGDLCFGQKC